MDPLTLPDADDPRLVWVGYPPIASPDRFAVADSENDLVYVYVPLDLACRWMVQGPQDRRHLILEFHNTPEHDARLADHRTRYQERAAVALDLWDHASEKFGKARPA